MDKGDSKAKYRVFVVDQAFVYVGQVVELGSDCVRLGTRSAQVRKWEDKDRGIHALYDGPDQNTILDYVGSPLLIPRKRVIVTWTLHTPPWEEAFDKLQKVYSEPRQKSKYKLPDNIHGKKGAAPPINTRQELRALVINQGFVYVGFVADEHEEMVTLRSSVQIRRFTDTKRGLHGLWDGPDEESYLDWVGRDLEIPTEQIIFSWTLHTPSWEKPLQALANNWAVPADSKNWNPDV